MKTYEYEVVGRKEVLEGKLYTGLDGKKWSLVDILNEHGREGKQLVAIHGDELIFMKEV